MTVFQPAVSCSATLADAQTMTQSSLIAHIAFRTRFVMLFLVCPTYQNYLTPSLQIGI